MRETKYKMFSKIDNRIYDVGKIDFEERKVYMKDGRNYTQSYYYFDDVELMEYTGLHDKNGKEIYGGYIIQYEDIHKGVVEYSEEYAQFILKETGNIADDYEALGEFNIKVFEIIGNIYENANLLKD